MQYTSKTLQCLEFNKITAMLSELCATDGAKQRALALMPTDDFEEIRLSQMRTEDAKRLINAKGYPSFYAPEGSVSSAERANKGAVLSPTELLDIASLLSSVDMLLDYIRTDKPFDTTLDELFLRLLPETPLHKKIRRQILSPELIADEASPELSDIRRKIRNANNKIKDTLSAFVSGSKLKYLQENIVTMRNGRYVVPVKNEYRNEIKGLVHDTSSSGATVFIEPMAVVDANNELKGLIAKEKHEIDRILAQLSASVGEYSSLISLNYHNITELALIFGKASLAITMKASMPIIVKERIIELLRARHPLLDKNTVVPIDLSVGESFDTLVITGPNTGGKTVSLKTAGLLTLMAQSGLQIPADENSKVGVFSSVLVDIGDEQSIEASLSTFSSHMVTVIDILGKISGNSLVLIDELGSGTDPIEGAGLATAILERTRELGALTLATTHYAELKAYALRTDRVQNASCEFDVKTLKPTYKLIIGSPGRSNAFAISKRLGMPKEIIERAEALIEGEDKRFEEVIARLDNERVKMESERERAETLRREYEGFKEKSESELKVRIQRSEKEAESALLRARQILDSARASSEFIFRQLEDIKKQEDKALRDKMLTDARERVRSTLREGDAMINELDISEIVGDDGYKLPRPLKVGDKVFVTTVAKEGVVTALADKSGAYAVQCGILKTKVKEEKLRLMDGSFKIKSENTAKPPKEGRVKRSVTSSFKIEIDVRGMIGDDAWFVVDKYLDDAMLASVASVRIIHGKGTGALRAALWKYFKADKRVKSFRHAEYGEGDAGVTVVELKK